MLAKKKLSKIKPEKMLFEVLVKLLERASLCQTKRCKGAFGSMRKDMRASVLKCIARPYDNMECLAAEFIHPKYLFFKCMSCHLKANLSK